MLFVVAVPCYVLIVVIGLSVVLVVGYVLSLVVRCGFGVCCRLLRVA